MFPPCFTLGDVICCINLEVKFFGGLRQLSGNLHKRQAIVLVHRKTHPIDGTPLGESGAPYNTLGLPIAQWDLFAWNNKINYLEYLTAALIRHTADWGAAHMTSTMMAFIALEHAANKTLRGFQELRREAPVPPAAFAGHDLVACVVHKEFRPSYGWRLFLWDNTDLFEDTDPSASMSPEEIQVAVEAVRTSLVATVQWSSRVRREIPEDLKLLGGIAVVDCCIEYDARIIETLQAGCWIRLRSVFLHQAVEDDKTLLDTRLNDTHIALLPIRYK